MRARDRTKMPRIRRGGHVTQINPGPVVTTFEFKPEAGIKYSRIIGLTEDLCLALQAESILIERIPGKSTIGIEVPNLTARPSRCAKLSKRRSSSIRHQTDPGDGQGPSSAASASPIWRRCRIC